MFILAGYEYELHDGTFARVIAYVDDAERRGWLIEPVVSGMPFSERRARRRVVPRSTFRAMAFREEEDSRNLRAVMLPEGLR